MQDTNTTDITLQNRNDHFQIEDKININDLASLTKVTPATLFSAKIREIVTNKVDNTDNIDIPFFLESMGQYRGAQNAENRQLQYYNPGYRYVHGLLSPNGTWYPISGYNNPNFNWLLTTQNAFQGIIRNSVDVQVGERWQATTVMEKAISYYESHDNEAIGSYLRARLQPMNLVTIADMGMEYEAQRSGPSPAWNKWFNYFCWNAVLCDLTENTVSSLCASYWEDSGQVLACPWIDPPEDAPRMEVFWGFTTMDSYVKYEAGYRNKELTERAWDRHYFIPIKSSDIEVNMLNEIMYMTTDMWRYMRFYLYNVGVRNYDNERVDKFTAAPDNHQKTTRLAMNYSIPFPDNTERGWKFRVIFVVTDWQTNYDGIRIGNLEWPNDALAQPGVDYGYDGVPLAIPMNGRKLLARAYLNRSFPMSTTSAFQCVSSISTWYPLAQHYVPSNTARTAFKYAGRPDADSSVTLSHTDNWGYAATYQMGSTATLAHAIQDTILVLPETSQIMDVMAVAGWLVPYSQCQAAKEYFNPSPYRRTLNIAMGMQSNAITYWLDTIMESRGSSLNDLHTNGGSRKQYEDICKKVFSWEEKRVRFTLFSVFTSNIVWAETLDRETIGMIMNAVRIPIWANQSMRVESGYNMSDSMAFTFNRYPKIWSYSTTNFGQRLVREGGFHGISTQPEDIRERASIRGTIRMEGYQLPGRNVLSGAAIPCIPHFTLNVCLRNLATYHRFIIEQRQLGNCGNEVIARSSDAANWVSYHRAPVLYRWDVNQSVNWIFSGANHFGDLIANQAKLLPLQTQRELSYINSYDENIAQNFVDMFSQSYKDSHVDEKKE